LEVVGSVGDVGYVGTVGDVGSVGSVRGVAEVAGSIHINSIVLFLFLFPFFRLGLVRAIIFQYFNISSFIFHIPDSRFHIFKKCSTHEQYEFHQEDVSWNRRNIKWARDALSGISVGML
jgi:hypothetical protein